MKFPGKPFVLLFLLVAAFSPAQGRKEKKGTTEQSLVNRIQGCLANKDAYCYIDLWPDLDTLTRVVMQVSDKHSRDFGEAQRLQDQPVQMMHADSLFKAGLKASFDSVIAAGDELGVHWESIIPVRYELVRQRETRDRLYEKLAPTRFTGYIFFVDAVSRRSFGMIAGDILQINGAWWGGRIRELYEASTRDEWEDARYFARKHRKETADSAKKSEAVATDEQQEANANAPEIIADRKLYAGKFDNEIPVQLYVRALKGGCPAGICSWEAIYKFGDQDDFVRLTVTRTEDGKWQMSEDPAPGVMELELKGKVFTGTWTSGDGQTGYDVKLSEIVPTDKKIKRLDDAFAELKKQK